MFRTKLIVTILIFLWSIPPSVSKGIWDVNKYPYFPAITKGNSEPLCKIFLNLTEQVFLTNSIRIEIYPMINSELKIHGQNKPLPVTWRDLVVPFKMPGSNTIKIFSMDINNDKTSELIVFHLNERGYKNWSYATYIYDTEKEFNHHLSRSKNLHDLLDQGKTIYTAKKPLSYLFTYDKKLYVLRENQSSGLKFSKDFTIDAIQPDSKLVTLCEIEFYTKKDNETIVVRKETLELLKDEMAQIGNEGDLCGTYPYYLPWHSRRSEFTYLRALFRPWVSSRQDKNSNFSYNRRTENFLAHWGYQDPWSWREYMTYQEIKELANIGMSKYLENEFGINKKQAEEYSKIVIHNIIRTNLVIPSSYPEFFTHPDYRNASEVLDVPENKAIKHGYLEFAIDNPDQLQQLLDKDMDQKVTNWFGKSALMYAAHLNSPEAITILINYGADVNLTTNRVEKKWCGDKRISRGGRTALMYAAENASPEVMKLLIDEGADTHAKDTNGNGISYYLSLNPRITKTLKNMHITNLVSTYSYKQDPGFNCKKAKKEIEKTICSNSTLSLYDRELTYAYSSVLGKYEHKYELRQSQLQWLKSRDDQCSGYTDKKKTVYCIGQITRARTRALFKLNKYLNK